MDKYYGYDGIDVSFPVDSGVTSVNAYKIVNIAADGEISADGTKTTVLTAITQEPYSSTTSAATEVRCRVHGLSLVRLATAVVAGDLVGPTGDKATTGQKVIGWCVAPGVLADSVGLVRIIQGGFTAA